MSEWRRRRSQERAGITDPMQRTVLLESDVDGIEVMARNIQRDVADTKGAVLESNEAHERKMNQWKDSFNNKLIGILIAVIIALIIQLVLTYAQGSS